MEKKTKSKKKLLTILLIVLLVLLLVLFGGYYAINKLFLMFSDSFYQVEPQASPVTSTQPTASPSGTEIELPSTDLNLTAEEAKAMIESISFSDKISVMNLLRSSLSAAQYKELLAMLGSGISREEVQRAKNILNENLSIEEKQKVLEYYKKYEELLE